MNGAIKFVKNCLTCSPICVTTVRMTIETRLATIAYSMAVAPVTSGQNRLREDPAA